MCLFGKIGSQLLTVRSSFFCVYKDSARTVKPVARVPREYMHMEVPKVLVAGRFVMLPNRDSFAVVRSTDCYGNLLGNLIDLANCNFWNIIDVFVMLIWDDDNMAFVIWPCSGGYKGCYIVGPENNVIFVVKFRRFTYNKVAERAYISVRFVIKHTDTINQTDEENKITPTIMLTLGLFHWQGHVESNHDLRFWRPLY